VYVHYSRIGGDKRRNYYCLWNKELLGENFYSRNGDLFSKALVVPFNVAFNIVEQFLKSDGELPDCVEWTEEKDLSDDAFPVTYDF